MADSEGWLYVATDSTSGVEFDGRLGETAIERFNRLHAIANTRALSEKERHILDDAFTEAKEEYRLAQIVTPKPTPAPPRKRVPRTAVENKPIVGDTAEAQAAPTIQSDEAPVDERVVVSRVAAETVPRATCGRLTRRAEAPMSSAEAAESAMPPTVTEAEQAALQSLIDHNDPTVAAEAHPTHGAPFSRAPASAADPIDLFTGAFTLSAVDLVVPSAISDIAFERCYRSGPPYFGPFGYGWDHSFNIYVRRLNDGRIALWTGRLREQYFLPEGAISWRCEPTLAASIEPLLSPADGFDITHPQGVRWRFERPSGWSHPERIPLVEIIDRHGNVLRLAYDTSSRLQSVLDDVGRGLLFSYGNCGLLEQVSDHTGTRVVRYEHHPEIEHLIRVVLPKTAAFPAGIATRYEYDLFGAHPAMRHNILRVIDSSDRIYLENEYAGPEARWAFNTVAVQRVGDGEFRFEYEQIQWVATVDAFVNDIATRTTVSRPDGALEFYTFNFRGDLLDHRYRLNADGSFRIVATQWTYDPHGNIVETVAPDGLRTVFTYDVTSPDPRDRRSLLRTELFSALPGGDPSRVIQQAHYDPTFQLRTRLIDEAGEETRFLYDFDTGAPAATGLLKQIVHPAATLPGGAVQISQLELEQNAKGQVIAMVAPGGLRTELEYETSGPHVGFLRRVVHDVAGAMSVTELGYDPTGFPQFVVEPDGARTDTLVNRLGQVEAVELPEVDGVRTTIRQTLSETGHPLRIELPRGAYAEPGLSDPFILDELEMDILGRPIGLRTAANTSRDRRSDWVLDYDGRPLAVLEPGGTWSTYKCDERGQLLRETSAAGEPEEAVATFGYDRAGRLEWASDPVGRTTRIELRDAWGRPIRVRRPSGASDELTWGPRDLLLERRVIGSPGPGEPARLMARDTFNYDERGRLTAQTQWSFTDDPTEATPVTTRIVHDLDDRPVRILLHRGGVITFAYDGLGRMTSASDVHGNTREFSYDSAGNLQQATQHDRFGATIRTRQFRYDHDARRRLRRVTAPGHTLELDYDDRNIVTERRESGAAITQSMVGPHGELDEILFDPGGLQLHGFYIYDPRGDLVAYTDPSGETTQWTRDALGRVVHTVLPDASEWQRSFDSAGRVTSTRTPSGVEVTYTHDLQAAQPTHVGTTVPLGRLSAGPYDFVYDGLERLVRAKGPSGEVARRYDSLDRLCEESALGKTLMVAVDEASGVTDLIFPDGRRERIVHDLGGRPTNITLVTPGALGGTPGELLCDITYGGVDRPTRITHGNGVAANFAYDDAARLIALDILGGGGLIDGVRMAHDERGRRALIQHLAPAASTLHRYDRRDRLIEARWGNAPPAINPEPSPPQQAALVAALGGVVAPLGVTYELDPADSRRKCSRAGPGGGTDFYTMLAGHRVGKAGGDSITYHLDGPRAADHRFVYEIDAFGRVVEVREAATNVLVAEFAYDALSRPAQGRLGGVDFHRWFLGTQAIEQRPGLTAPPVRQWTPHPLWPTPICTGDATGQAFIHADGGYASLCTTDAAGAVIERHRYGPFGKAQILNSGGGTTGQPPADGAWWRGMPLLWELGLYYTPRRLYDPDVGVFLARDPSLYGDSPSPYAFAAHNPVDFADPAGRNKSPLNEDGNWDSGNRLERPPGIREDDWFRRWDAIPGRPVDTPPLIRRSSPIGGAGQGLRYATPPRFTLQVPDSYDLTKLSRYHRAVLQGRIGKNAGSGANTNVRRETAQQRWARNEFRRRTFPNIPDYSPQGNKWHPDHIIELQHDLWGISGDSPLDYRPQDGPLNMAEGRESWQLQRNNPLGMPAGAVVRKSQAGRWYNSVSYRRAQNAGGTLMTAYGIYESGVHIRDAAYADIRQGTMGELTLQAVTEEVGGWAAALAMGTEGAALGGLCGPAAWICMPIGGLVGGAVGYWAGSHATSTTLHVGKVGIDVLLK